MGAARRVLPDATALTPNRVKGMFKAGKFIYFADSQNGRLKRVQFVNNKFKGAARVANTEIDWRANAMFLSSQWAILADNVDPSLPSAPTALGVLHGRRRREQRPRRWHRRVLR